MCGINGVVRLRPGAPTLDREELQRTSRAQSSRGPDGEGEWLSPSGLAAFGHRRLAIIDLSPTAAQPMCSADGRYVLVFNGEIYNYRELRQELEQAGTRFRTQSDSEVLLALYARDGAAMLPRLRGMFAIALWDETERRLLLARDAYGIKPLYYAANADVLRFASQLKALEAGGAVASALDPAAVVGFLLWGSVPEPLTLRRDVRAVPAGHLLLAEAGRISEPRPFRRLVDRSAGPTAPIEAALEASVAAHLVSDVPVAVFLSAGLDSSLIAALACRRLPEPPVTLTLRFAEYAGTEDDEGPLAAEVARRLGTRHEERLLRREELVEAWAPALAAMDQPTIDGFNSYLISQAAHEAGLKVVLSGLGGDELFGSYSSFRDVPRWTGFARWAGRVPGAEALWPRLAARWRPAQPKLKGLLRYGASWPGAYFLRRGLFLPEEIPALLPAELAEPGLAAYDPVADAARDVATTGGDAETNGDAWRAVQLLESTRYMRNQLLRDADWASMAHSLELRVPLVDATLFESARAAGFEPARTEGKAALVRRLAPDLPGPVFARRKTGFSLPVAAWRGAGSGRPPGRGGEARWLAAAVLESFGVELRERGSHEVTA
jgi:asparagine synthase (glutamine-hydrolysing)